ncbi:MAG: hypothetical protein FWH12_03315 [Treponema sp.]|nr:hypothetical protein [Treponema sp.]
MAIQPIDLQALFSQLHQVGKTQAMAREGQQIQENLQAQQSQRRLEENIQAVNEAQNMGDEAEKIKDENRGRNSMAGQGGPGKEEEDQEEERALHVDVIRDPALGRNLDISG